MDQLQVVNKAELRGVVGEAPQFSHESRGEKFFQFPMEVERLSGAVDRINVVVREQLIADLELIEEEKIHVVGELRSFNNKSGEGSRLIITVFAREIYFDSGDDINSISLTGCLCKPPNLRGTPMGREICDILIAVNRRYGRSDYLPCISWGLKAKEASLWQVGDCISLEGRIQSRKYIKTTDGVSEEKVAFEVSVTEAKLLPKE